MAVKIIKCPWCEGEARITYEENRVYQMKCYSCHNTMLHVDHSFDSAVEFFEHQAKLLQAEKDGRMVMLPCKAGDQVLVDARTLPYNYLHPADGCGDFAKCEVVAIVTTKKETYLKLRALYPSRSGRRDYLKYGVTVIGKTVFLTREAAEAETALKGGEG